MVAASAPMSESAAVRLRVMTRTLSVGRTFRNESTELSRVSEPPYMFSAVTETRPRVARMNDRAEPDENVVADFVELSDTGAIEALASPGSEHGADDHHPATAERRSPVGPEERLAHWHVRRQVAGTVRDVDGPADLIAGHHPELAEERARVERADAERAGRVVDEKERDREDPEDENHGIGEPPLSLVDQVISDQCDDEGHDRRDDNPQLGRAVRGAAHSVASQDGVENVEAGVLDVGEEPDQERPDVAELRARLDHLRQAELGSLRGVERHEQRADQHADHDG